MKKSVFVITFFMASLLLARSAYSHPHMFLDTTASFRIDNNSQLQSIRLRFVVDELNTALTIATLDLDKDGDKVFSAEDKRKVAGNVVEGFGHYNFFTYLFANNQKVPMQAPDRADVIFTKGRLVISMEIFLDEPFSIAGTDFSLKLYDPTYFTEVTVKEKPQIIGDDKRCRVIFHKATPDDNSRKLQTALSQLSREETPEIENVGALFADRTRLTCAG